MFIVWGKKYTYRKLGYVADFCPICRKTRPFEIKRIGLASHVYYISFGHGEEVGHERSCQKCPTILNAKLTDYASIPNTLLPMNELIKTSYPDIEDVYQYRLELEEKVQKTPALLTREERDALIRSPFIILAPIVQRRLDKTHIDLNILIAFIAAFLLMIVVPPLVERYSLENAPAAFATCLAMAALIVLWQFVTAGKRYVVRDIAPIVGITLKPLKPSESELLSIFNELRKTDNKVVRKLKVSDVLQYT